MKYFIPDVFPTLVIFDSKEAIFIKIKYLDCGKMYKIISQFVFFRSNGNDTLVEVNRKTELSIEIKF